jgi:hypothetical protein
MFVARWLGENLKRVAGVIARTTLTRSSLRLVQRANPNRSVQPGDRKPPLLGIRYCCV